ncbi:MAG: GNAT family N-acetyltransferase [Chloroflexia bacterium]|nr:GNAT family N-acetyltransferase [Chloroflexia bacterium]
MSEFKIRKATSSDFEAVWDIFCQVVKSGDTYVFDPNTPKEDLQNHWFAPNMHTFVLEKDSSIPGTYIIKPNQIGLGNHVANGAYMVHPKAQGQGIGKKLCEHSIIEAKRLGFKAMQFNFVVSTNKAAVKLWQKYGFEIIGTIPEAFRHQKLGLVAAHVMHKKL